MARTSQKKQNQKQCIQSINAKRAVKKALDGLSEHNVAKDTIPEDLDYDGEHHSHGDIVMRDEEDMIHAFSEMESAEDEVDDF